LLSNEFFVLRIYQKQRRLGELTVLPRPKAGFKGLLHRRAEKVQEGRVELVERKEGLEGEGCG